MNPTFSRKVLVPAIAASVALGAVACAKKEDASGQTGSTSGGASAGAAGGAVIVSGSSTVKPISQRVAELLEDKGSKVKVTVDGPGTGDGFKLFCKGETDISDASRPITKAEADECAANGIEYVELKVAVDGMTVMTNPANSLECLTLADLYALLGPESEGFRKWSDAQALASELGSTTTFPDAPLDITAPGTESGTYDSFYELALQKTATKRAEAGKLEVDDTGKPKQKTRKDYSSQANDNAIISGIEGSKSSLGWVGFAYAEEAGPGVKELEIDGGKGCVAPTPETISAGTYPLARNLYIYVNKKRVDSNPAVKAYVDFYLSDDGIAAVEEVDYIGLPDDELQKTRKVWESMEVGSRDGNK